MMDCLHPRSIGKCNSCCKEDAGCKGREGSKENMTPDDADRMHGLEDNRDADSLLEVMANKLETDEEARLEFEWRMLEVADT